MPRYDDDVKRIEAKWQAYWDEHQTFRVDPHDSEGASADKLYVLDMFPYPSGAGLHVGHPEGYTATDIVCRFNRMRGKQVLHPMGWDAFGLPAEDYAIKTGTHPAITTAKNIETFKRQLKSLGSAMTGVANSPPPIRTTTAGPSGFFSNCSTPGTMRTTSGPGRMGRLARVRDAPSPTCPSPPRSHRGEAKRSDDFRISIGWHISTRPRSTGVRNSEQFWPTKKSSTERANAAGILSNESPCGSGCFASQRTATDSRRNWMSWIGPSRSS